MLLLIVCDDFGPAAPIQDGFQQLSRFFVRKDVLQFTQEVLLSQDPVLVDVD